MIMQRQPDGTYAEVEIISDGVDEIDRIVDSNGDVYYQSRIMKLSSLAGAFDATVSGFVNPVWEYNGERQSGNTGKFTILNDGDVVKLRWDGVERRTGFTANTRSRAYFNANLKDFRRKITNYLNLFACPKITGKLSDLGGKIAFYLNLFGCSNITGDLSDLGGNIGNTLRLDGCKQITGKLSDLDGKISHLLSLSNCSQITGDLSDLYGHITHYLNLSNCSQITGIYTPIDASGVPLYISLSKTSITTSDMDATLNNISITTKHNGEFTASGMTRSSASDAAVEKLVSQGWTISGLTKLEG